MPSEFKLKSLLEIAKETGHTPRSIWKVLSGKTTEDYQLAKVLEESIGTNFKPLLFNKTKNFRNNVLVWLEDYLLVTKTTISRSLHGYRPPGTKLQKKIFEFSGLEVQYWDPDKIHNNWFMSVSGRKKVEKALQLNKTLNEK